MSMSYTQFAAHIDDQTIRLSNLPVLASGNEGVVRILCDFCPLWNGYGKTAVFHRRDGAVYHIPLVENAVIVPQEVLADEGHFYFGIMGVADNVRTTEVVRIEVVRGAITTATAEPDDPTPDIYQQLVAAYGLAEARLNEVVAMRGTDNTATMTISDDYFNGNIRSNGTGAHIYIVIDGLSLVGYGEHISDEYRLPAAFAPLGNVVLSCNSPDLEVTCEITGSSSSSDGETYVLMRVRIRNLSSEYVQHYGPVADGYCPTAGIAIAELADLRIGADGKTYSTAGEAIRAQFLVLRAQIAQLTEAIKALGGSV